MRKSKNLMKTQLYFTVFLYLFSTHLWAQTTFLKTIDGLCPYSENAYSAIQTKDGGYIVSGATSCQGQGSYDLSVIRMDNVGNVVWTTVMGSGSQEYGFKILQSSDSTYAIAGYVDNGGTNDMFLCNLNDQGDTLWTKKYGFSSQDYAQNMIQTFDKNFVLVGSVRNTNTGDDNIYLVKVDEEGNLLWSKSYGGSSSDYGYGITELTDGSLVFVGFTSSYGSSQDMIVIKTDHNGNILWSETIGNSDSDYAYDVQGTPDGGVIVCGKSRKSGLDDVYLVKLDKDGNEEWGKLYGEASSNDIAYKVLVVADGYVLSGESNSYGTGQYDLMMIGTNKSGVVKWANKYGFDNVFDYGGYASLANDGGIVLTGQSRKASGLKDYDWLIAKTDNNGNVDCQSAAIVPTETSPSLTFTNITITDSLLSSNVSSGTIAGSYSSYTDSMHCLTIAQLSAYYTYTGASCSGGSVSFTDQSYNAIAWAWDFGDPNSGANNTSSLQNPAHLFSNSGSYTVTLIVSDGSTNTDTVSMLVNISIAANPVQLGNDTTKCGDDGMPLNAGAGYTSYVWNTGSKDSVIYIVNIGTYYVTVTDQNGCTSTDTIIISECVHTGIQALENFTTLVLYPNPVQNQLFIQTHDNIFQIDVIDMLGKTVKEYRTIANNTVSTADLADGIYTLRLFTSGGCIIKPLIKAKL